MEIENEFLNKMPGRKKQSVFQNNLRLALRNL